MSYYNPAGPYTPYNGYNYSSPLPSQQSPQPQLSQYAFVNGLEGAKAFALPANQSMLLMDASEPICYKKTVDGFGQFTIKAYQLVEVDLNNQ